MRCTQIYKSAYPFLLWREAKILKRILAWIFVYLWIIPKKNLFLMLWRIPYAFGKYGTILRLLRSNLYWVKIRCCSVQNTYTHTSHTVRSALDQLYFMRSTLSLYWNHWRSVACTHIIERYWCVFCIRKSVTVFNSKNVGGYSASISCKDRWQNRVR